MWATTILTWATWFFDKGLAGITAAWKTSRMATEVVLVGVVGLVVLMYFGFVSKPDVTSGVAAQVSVLSLKLDKLQKAMATKDDVSFIEDQISGLKKPVTVTGSIVHKSKVKVDE